MQKLWLLLTAVFFSLALSACSQSTTTEVQFTDAPVGTTTTLKNGTIATTAGSPPTTGGLSLVQDANSTPFVSLNSNFVSDFGTGTVAVYLAKSDAKIKDQRTASASNVLAVGFVSKNGQQFLKLPKPYDAAFTHVVFYCETVEINFGTAPLVNP